MANDGTYESMSKPPGEDRSDEFEWGNYTITESTLVFTVAILVGGVQVDGVATHRIGERLASLLAEYLT